ncbi:MAG: Fur family transcriptional regulator [Chloroflexota bacterium]
MLASEKRLVSALRQNGFKLTPGRRLLIGLITASHEHLTPAELFERARKINPGISLVTVYRTLELLMGLGFICQVHSEGDCHSYLLRPEARHHHHLVCADCGRVIDFTGCNLSALEARITRKTGFKVESHLLEFSGKCASCLGKPVGESSG